MSKIVLDTNVVIAAFAARGLCEAIFELCLEKHELITSDFLLEEFRRKLIKKIRMPADLVEEILLLYSKNSQKVIPAVMDGEICRDPKDIPVIGTCVSGSAEYLISGDQDLLILENFQKTKIVSPRQFYDLHNSK
ncbi:putative toxin-antitoxin system toxin component, PIN family [Oscillatoria laete-virens NRMC-F 0139]|nr:putative toxin-antitoxin system toxin component, PIN family [Oscillatoria laete-virens NRMC-F 0139]